MKKENIKKVVRKRYAAAAKEESSCCGPVNPCCSKTDTAKEISRTIGYSEQEINAVPEGANLGLGCGNPVALASLKEGETVLDLGAGAGFDCFLAAQRVGPLGKVIGVDMTPEMIDKARENAKKGKYHNVEFRLGEIENLPAGDNTIDVIISNCVINLSPDKEQVFKEAFRVLKPNARVMISDIVLLKELPDFIMESKEAYTACITGAIQKQDYLETMRKAGFSRIEIMEETHFPVEYFLDEPLIEKFMKKNKISRHELEAAAGSVVSIKVKGIKR